jgi:hypothetical protein
VLKQPTNHYCERGHWVTRETDYERSGTINCARCQAYSDADLGRPPGLWDEATLAPDAELAVDLAAVREATAGWPVLARLQLGLRMQDGRSPFPGGRV